MGGWAAIDLTAVRATALAAVSALPLLVRIVRTGNGDGVTLVAATIGAREAPIGRSLSQRPPDQDDGSDHDPR
jgi:hypothetical protein